MLLGFKKIGKSKQKFLATIQFIEAANLNTQRGFRFKVKFERGSHQIEAISEPVKKGVAKFSPLEYVIPMSLFREEQQIQGKYLEKEVNDDIWKATVKIYQISQSSSQQFKIGTKTIDLGEFAEKGQLQLQLQFKGENKSDKPSLQLHIKIERQPNDTKSNETSSQNTDQRVENKVVQRVDSKQVKSELNEIKTEKENEKIRKKRLYSQQLCKQQLKTNLKRQPPQMANQQMTKKVEKKNGSLRDQKTHINGFSLPKNQQVQTDSNVNIFQGKSKIEQGESQGFKNREKADKNKLNEKKKEDNQGQSSQLQIFLLKKSVKDKEAEITNLKRLNEQLRKTIEKIVEQASTLKQAQKNTGYQKQVEEMKKVLITKDIAIDKLTTSNKSLMSRQQEYEKTIIKLRQQLMMSNEKISQMKYRQAFLMQELFETDNKQGLEEASRFLSV